MSLPVRLLVSVSLALSLLVSVASAAEEPSARDSLDDSYKWDPSPVYADTTLWRTDYERVNDLIEQYGQLRGIRLESPVALTAALVLKDSIGSLTDRVWLYANLTYDIDTRNSGASARYQVANDLYSKFGEASAWLEPALLELKAETITGWLNETEALAPYRFFLTDLIRQREHYLSTDEEQLLSYFGSFGNSPVSAYNALSITDIVYPDYVLKSGDTITLTDGQTWYQMRTNPDQEERREIMSGMVSAYQKNINTFAAMYNQVLQRDWANARARHYPTTLHAYLDPENVPVEVYETLITTVKQGLDPIKKYHRLRKERLGLEHYYSSDRSIPIVEFTRTYEWDEILPWVIESVAPLGEEYQRRIEEMITGRWIDVYETEGKYGGGYQTGAYGVHPYILMNFNGTLDEVFTLAHEAGHAVHNMYCDENQPYVTSVSGQFFWEVPSTFNEALFLDYMIARSDDPVERVALLERAIQNISGTFVTQVFFADFERQAHAIVERGEPVTAESLGDLYRNLYSEYYGDAVETDSVMQSAYWSRISHFWSHVYYVYKYATSYAASAQLVADVRSDDATLRQGAIDRYMTLLKSGGDDYAIAQLQKAGVDMTAPKPVTAVLAQLDQLVNLLEQELQKL